MALTGIWKGINPLRFMLNYVSDPSKTLLLPGRKTAHLHPDGEKDAEERTLYLSGINCRADRAFEEMTRVREYWQEFSGIDKARLPLYAHGYLSFDEGEATPEMAHEIGRRLAKTVWGDAFLVVVATHGNTKYLHDHFVVCWTSLKTGKALAQFLRRNQMKEASNALCRQYGLSVPVTPSRSRKESFLERQDRKAGRWTIRTTILRDLFDSAFQSLSERELVTELQRRGYRFSPEETEIRSILPPGSEHFFQLHRLRSGFQWKELLETVEREGKHVPQDPKQKREERERLLSDPPFLLPAKTFPGKLERTLRVLQVWEKQPGELTGFPLPLRHMLAKRDRWGGALEFSLKREIFSEEDLSKVLKETVRKRDRLGAEKKLLLWRIHLARRSGSPSLPELMKKKEELVLQRRELLKEILLLGQIQKDAGERIRAARQLIPEIFEKEERTNERLPGERTDHPDHAERRPLDPPGERAAGREERPAADSGARKESGEPRENPPEKLAERGEKPPQSEDRG